MNNTPSDDDMQSEYDFSRGVRGKYTKVLQGGYRIRIHQADGTIVEEDWHLPEGAILLDPDVRAYFPDAQAVNTALRGLIKLIPPVPVPPASDQE